VSTNIEDIARDWHRRKTDSAGCRPATLQNWRIHIDRYIVPTLGHVRVQQVTMKQVEDAAAEWSKTTSPNTSNKTLTTLGAIFKLAQRYNLIKQNPAALAERVKISSDSETDSVVLPDEVYGVEELKKLINATAAGTMERSLLMVPALLGLRIGEVLGLQWSGVDLKANKLHVRTNLVNVGKKNGGRELRTPKSTSSRRTLDLPQELTHELRLWKLICPLSEAGLVFCTMEGKPLHRKAVTTVLDQAITVAGIKRLTLHRLRHTFASLLLSRGVPITKVSAYLGHRDPVITLKVYSHLCMIKKTMCRNWHRAY
jgi:integrase